MSEPTTAPAAVEEDDETFDDGFEQALDTFLDKQPDYVKGDRRLLMAIDFLSAWQAGCAVRDEIVKADALADAAGRIRHLFLNNPMNGDGHNYGLGKALNLLAEIGGTPVVEAIAKAEEEIAEEDERLRRRIEDLNRDRAVRQPDACPECSQGKHQNCTGTVLDSNDAEVSCPCRDREHAP